MEIGSAGCRELKNEKLHIFYSWHYSMGVIKAKKIKWAKLVACIEM
jgi:hypothetical protein